MRLSLFSLLTLLALPGCMAKERPILLIRSTPPALVAIERECGLNGDLFHVISEDQLMLIPDPYEEYVAIDCAIAAFKRTEFSKQMKIGFVGNSKFAEEEKE